MPRPYLRSPALAGNRLAFVADDDVWLVAVDGGPASRLTSDRVPVRALRMSPDGAWVAYLGAADGPSDVYVAATDGAERRRLTWWASTTTTVLGWDGDAVIAATAATEPLRSRTWAWRVSLDGGAPQRLPFGPISALARAASGATVLGVDQSRRRGAAWKRYRGGTAAKVWLDPDGNGTFARLGAGLDGQLEDPRFMGERIVFLSDHEGYGNVYSLAADGDDLRRHSDHVEEWARTADGDGTRYAYQAGGDLWVLDDLAADGAPRRLDITLTGVRTGRAPAVVDVARDLRRVDGDGDGRGAALEVRGAAVWLTYQDGPARILSPGGAVRARLARAGGSGDDAVVVWITDAIGGDAIAVASVAGPACGEPAPPPLATGRLGRVVDLAVAPDGRRAAVATHDGRVVLVNLTDGESTEVHRSAWDTSSGLAFSPDSAWLAWSAASGGPEGALRQILLVPTDGGDVIEATPSRFNDRAPTFTLDGRYLAFLSTRTFDPVYDEIVFDLGFPAASRPYLLALTTDTVSPLGPWTGGRVVAPAGDSTPGPTRPAPQEPGAPLDPTVADTSASDTDTGADVVVRVDVDGIAARLVALPVAAGRTEDLVAVVGGVVWRSLPPAGAIGDDRPRPGDEPAKASAVRFDLATGRTITLADDVDAVSSTAQGRALVIRTAAGLRVVPSDRPLEAKGGPDPARVDVDLQRVHLDIDPPVEWAQMLAEAGQLMRDHFWVADMGGVDWDAAVERHRRIAKRLATRDELSEVIWELHGELGSSHAYEMPHPVPVPAARQQGYLGADLITDEDGRWRVAAVVPPDDSVPTARSPLDAPGVAIGAGDAILAVDGRPVDARRGPAPLLVGAASTPVELTVEPAAGGPARVVTVVPLADEQPLRYQAWVAANRRAVRAASGGRVGYLHVPDMQVRGWAELNRDLRIEMACDALVLDLRNNGGGHLSQLVLEKLGRVVTAWEVIRHQQPSTYPVDARRGPMVTLIDQDAGSDGDIAAAGIRQRNLGLLVGTRTWGGVIGIDGRYELADGAVVTQPRYAFWFVDSGWGVENHGVDPDVEIPYAPQDWAAGRDPQLEAGIRHVLEALDAAPAVRPPTTDDRPDRRPGPLPPRPTPAG